MPVKSEKQRRFFEAVKHNPEFAGKAGVPQHVAEEFLGKSDEDPVKAYMDAVKSGDSQRMAELQHQFRN
jgi:nicotinamide riboside kinase